MYEYCKIFKETELFIIKLKVPLPFSSPWLPLTVLECVSFQIQCACDCVYVCVHMFTKKAWMQISNINRIIE